MYANNNFIWSWFPIYLMEESTHTFILHWRVNFVLLKLWLFSQKSLLKCSYGPQMWDYAFDIRYCQKWPQRDSASYKIAIVFLQNLNFARMALNLIWTPKTNSIIFTNTRIAKYKYLWNPSSERYHHQRIICNSIFSNYTYNTKLSVMYIYQTNETLQQDLILE